MNRGFPLELVRRVHEAPVADVQATMVYRAVVGELNRAGREGAVEEQYVARGQRAHELLPAGSDEAVTVLALPPRPLSRRSCLGFLEGH